jgi:hypothetical protein
LEDFKGSCENTECRINMARRNKKPPMILAKGEVVSKVRHDPRCTCNRCLEEGAAQVEKAWEEFNKEKAGKPPVQVPIRVVYRESQVTSSYDDGEDTVYLDVPTVFCGNIYPKGKRRA